MIRETPSVPSTEDPIALIAALRAENESLKARIAELERQLGLNSSNSGKPPSSDGLKKPARVTSLRERSAKQPGGQRGHKGETLRQVADPDDVVDHYPSACSGCGAGLDPDTSIGHSARQVFDLPEPQPLIVTEHRAHDCRCPACGAKTRAAFPDGVNAPVQYGTRIGAFVLYLLHYQLLPEKRLVQLLADLLGVKLVTATIARISQDCARRFQGFADVVRDHVAAAPVKHMDETGFRIGGRTQWQGRLKDEVHQCRTFTGGTKWARNTSNWGLRNGVSLQQGWNRDQAGGQLPACLIARIVQSCVS